MSRRLGLWISVLALPLAALGLLLAEPDLDLRWEHHPSHHDDPGRDGLNPA